MALEDPPESDDEEPSIGRIITIIDIKKLNQIYQANRQTIRAVFKKLIPEACFIVGYTEMPGCEKKYRWISSIPEWRLFAKHYGIQNTAKKWVDLQIFTTNIDNMTY